MCGGEGSGVLPHRRVAGIARDPSGEFVVETESSESIDPIVAERVLLATGRRPAVDHLGLKAAGGELNARRRLEIGGDMGIKGKDHNFAAGDVAGLRIVRDPWPIEAGDA